jgi:spermidine synthase
MFASFLIRPEPERVVLIGLGGGSMVRFLARHFPAIDVTAVELDQAVVDAARDYFGVVETPHLHVVTADGFAFFAATDDRWDVIYMDAFVEPSNQTDDAGVPLRMQTVAFLRRLRAHLRDDGLFVVNLHHDDDTGVRVAAIEEVFANTYLFNGGGNVIVMGSVSAARVDGATMRARGRELDARVDHGFSFAGLARAQTDEMFE